jgi:hypothetical protein
MAGEAYPDVPLYRYGWTALTEAAMREQLAPVAGRGPEPAKAGSASLEGRSLRIVTDNGPTLAYRFVSPTQLMYGEGDEAAFAAGYGALKADHVTLFTHLIPGSLRGYVVAIDEDTRLATVVELWFGAEPRPREVTREIHHGYVMGDGDAPKARHASTARVEGRAYAWKDDRGFDTLEFYCTVSYCNVVDRTRDKGEFGYAFPADYIRLTEDLYLLTRVEAEFSGIMTLFVLDSNRLTRVGMRLGFNTGDQLEYYMFNGEAEWLGQIARFEEFGDVSGSPLKPPTSDKGSRVVYRPFTTMEKLSKEKVAELGAAPKAFESVSPMAGHGNPPTAALAGRELSIRYDGGPAMDYRFKTADTLEWRKDGGSWTEARYNAWEAAPGAFLFGHFLKGEPNFDGHIVTMDLDAGLATLFRGYLNTPYVPNEAWSDTHFGVVSGDGIPDPGGKRHQFSNDMVGRCLTWSYSPGLTSMHLYSTPNTVSWIIFTPDGHGGSSWAGPGEFVKIRDGLYFQYWREDACNGTLGTILVNMRTMHDAGIGYHCGERGGLSMSPVGAYARHAGKFDVGKYFNGKRRA